VLIGPYGLGGLADEAPFLRLLTISDPAEIRVLAELGVILLLFMIGLELSFERLMRLRRYILGLGGLQVAVTALVIGGVAYLLGLRLGAAAALGVALALSSTAIVMPVLQEREAHETPSGQLSFSVLLAQDLALAPILFLIGAATDRYEAGFAQQLLRTAVPVGVVFAVLLASGRLLLRPVLRAAAGAPNRELFVAACLFVVLVTGLIAQAGGLSMALGAFIAGLLLAETEYQHEVEVTIDPFKGLFLGAFFLAVGIELNVGVILEQPLLVLGAAVGLIVLKAAIVVPLARLFGASTSTALQAGLVLAAGGEFAFVILGAALGADLIEPGLAELAVVTATLTMFAVPPLAFAADRIGRLAERRAAAADDLAMPEEAPAAEVMIVGFGRVGQLVADMLGRHGKSYLAIDNDPELVARHRRQGVPIVYGDASRAALLERSGLAKANALVVTLDAWDASEQVVSAARALRPDLTLVARAQDDRHAARLYELGVTDAVPETIEASLQLAENTLVDIGVPMGWVIASVHEKREEFRALFREKIEGDREPRAMRSAQTDQDSMDAFTRSGAGGG
jgi:CPA2 family monovalent cation:H+ antiporter-2